MPAAEANRLLIDRALGWILAHLDQFDPFRGGRPFAIKQGQRVGELAILLHAYAALGGDRDGEASAPPGSCGESSSPGAPYGSVVRRLVSLLAAVRGNRQLSHRLLRSPAELVLFVEIYAALRSVGHDDPGDRALIQRALDARLPEQLERLPHRMMDIASCLEWGGFEHPWPGLRQLYGASILGTTPSALLLGEDGMYGITHVVMYLYGFGVRRARIPRRQRESLRRLLSMLLVGVSQDRHWDLLAELLLCWEAIGYAATALSERCWEALLAAQREDGSIPGPEWALPLYESAARGLAAGSEAEREARFAHHYHTTLVAVIAGCLRRRNLRRAGRRGTKAPRAAVPAAAAPRTGSREVSSPGAGTSYGSAGAPQTSSFEGSSQGAGTSYWSVAAAAAGWLEGVLDTLCRAPEARAEDLFRILLGLHCAGAMADRVGEREAAGRRAAARRVAARLAAPGMRGEGSAAAPPLLTFGAAALLAGEGHYVAELHGPWGFPAAAARLLAALPEDPGDAASMLELHEKRAWLHALGLLPAAPRGMALAAVLERARALPVTAPWEAWEDLLLRIDAATGCGARTPLAPADGRGRDDLEELVCGKAMHLLRRYDLPLGARMLRGMTWLGFTGEGWRDCLRFLLLHQRLDGAFGFYGLEEARLAETMPAAFSTTTDLSLVVTVECLWTLAESTGWRLLASLPALRAAGPPRREGNLDQDGPGRPLPSLRSLTGSLPRRRARS